MNFLKIDDNTKLKKWFELYPRLCLLKEKIPTIRFSSGFRASPSSYFLNYTIKNYEWTLEVLEKYLANPIDSELTEQDRGICHEVINGIRPMGSLSGRIGAKHGRKRKG